MYVSSLERYFWMSGMLFGLAVGGVVLYFAVRTDKSGVRGRWDKPILTALVVTQFVALAVGCSAEWRTVQGTVAVGEMRSNGSLEPTSAAQLQR